MKNIINRDSSGMLDGYQERYNINDTMQTRINFKNNKPTGYAEWHGISHSMYYIQ